MDAEYISGGYFLTKPFLRAECMSVELVPERVLTLSTCLTERFPDGWPTPGFDLTRDERRSKVQDLGISPDRADEVAEWAKLHPPDPPSIWPYAFVSVETAREFARTFIEDAGYMVLVGPALREDLADVFLAEAGEQYGGNTSELVEAVRQRRPPAPGGQSTGFEVICDGIADDHSLLCNALEVDIDREFGIRLNQCGLIDTFEEAKRVADWASLDEACESGLWLPWLIARYGWK